MVLLSAIFKLKVPSYLQTPSNRIYFRQTFSLRNSKTIFYEPFQPISTILAGSACLCYAGSKHFVFALGPSALGWGKVIQDFTNLAICFFSHRDNVPINNHCNYVSRKML